MDTKTQLDECLRVLYLQPPWERIRQIIVNMPAPEDKEAAAKYVRIQIGEVLKKVKE